jgi:hypothetical protein
MVKNRTAIAWARDPIAVIAAWGSHLVLNDGGIENGTYGRKASLTSSRGPSPVLGILRNFGDQAPAGVVVN